MLRVLNIRNALDKGRVSESHKVKEKGKEETGNMWSAYNFRENEK